MALEKTGKLREFSLPLCDHPAYGFGLWLQVYLLIIWDNVWTSASMYQSSWRALVFWGCQSQRCIWNTLLPPAISNHSCSDNDTLEYVERQQLSAVVAEGIGWIASSRDSSTRERRADKTVDKRTWSGACYIEQSWIDGWEKCRGLHEILNQIV